MHEALKISKKTSKILKSDFQWVAVLNRLKTKLTSGKSGNAQVKYQYFNLKTLPYIMWDSQTSALTLSKGTPVPGEIHVGGNGGREHFSS